MQYTHLFLFTTLANHCLNYILLKINEYVYCKFLPRNSNKLKPATSQNKARR